MSRSKKHFPQQFHNGSVLLDIPDSKMREFVDRLLARIPPHPVPTAAPKLPKSTEPVETKEDALRKNRSMIAIAVLALPMVMAFTTAASAAIEVETHRYQCDRGVQIPATYVTDTEEAIVILHVEGQQITLYRQSAASGVRYGWPSDGSNYVWLTQGDTATLSWRDGTDQTEAPLVEGCRVLPL